MSVLTETAPRRIYLCISDDEDHYDEPWPERYPEDESITWSDDQPVACTVGYVREDLVDEVRADNERLRADVVAAAGELMVDVPEPGTDMSRVMLANAHMRRERDEALAENKRLRSSLAMVGMLRQLGGMMPGTAQVVRSVVDAVDAALAKEGV